MDKTKYSDMVDSFDLDKYAAIGQGIAETVIAVAVICTISGVAAFSLPVSSAVAGGIAVLHYGTHVARCLWGDYPYRLDLGQPSAISRWNLNQPNDTFWPQAQRLMAVANGAIWRQPAGLFLEKVAQVAIPVAKFTVGAVSGLLLSKPIDLE